MNKNIFTVFVVLVVFIIGCSKPNNNCDRNVYVIVDSLLQFDSFSVEDPMIRTTICYNLIIELENTEAGAKIIKIETLNDSTNYASIYQGAGNNLVRIGNIGKFNIKKEFDDTEKQKEYIHKVYLKAWWDN